MYSEAILIIHTRLAIGPLNTGPGGVTCVYTLMPLIICVTESSVELESGIHLVQLDFDA